VGISILDTPSIRFVIDSMTNCVGNIKWVGQTCLSLLMDTTDFVCHTYCNNEVNRVIFLSHRLLYNES
jgi:hypothetical protein